MELNENEKKILARLVRGESDEEIADFVGLPRRTVKYYVGRLLAAFGAANRSRLIASYWEGERAATLESLRELQGSAKSASNDVKSRIEELVRFVGQSIE